MVTNAVQATRPKALNMSPTLNKYSKFKTFGLENPIDTPTTCAAAYAAIVV
jgi:hypothetical protein